MKIQTVKTIADAKQLLRTGAKLYVEAKEDDKENKLTRAEVSKIRAQIKELRRVAIAVRDLADDALDNADDPKYVKKFIKSASNYAQELERQKRKLDAIELSI